MVPEALLCQAEDAAVMWVIYPCSPTRQALFSDVNALLSASPNNNPPS